MEQQTNKFQMVSYKTRLGHCSPK